METKMIKFQNHNNIRVIQQVIEVLKLDGVNSKQIAINLLEKIKDGEAHDQVRS